MLVLSRKKQECVIVADPADGSCLVKITVLEVREGQVRLGFEAGPGVPVHRWEVWQRMLTDQHKLRPSNGNGVSVAQAEGPDTFEGD